MDGKLDPKKICLKIIEEYKNTLPNHQNRIDSTVVPMTEDDLMDTDEFYPFVNREISIYKSKMPDTIQTK